MTARRFGKIEAAVAAVPLATAAFMGGSILTAPDAHASEAVAAAPAPAPEVTHIVIRAGSVYGPYRAATPASNCQAVATMSGSTMVALNVFAGSCTRFITVQIPSRGWSRTVAAGSNASFGSLGGVGGTRMYATNVVWSGQNSTDDVTL